MSGRPDLGGRRKTLFDFLQKDKFFEDLLEICQNAPETHTFAIAFPALLAGLVMRFCGASNDISELLPLAVKILVLLAIAANTTYFLNIIDKLLRIWISLGVAIPVASPGRWRSHEHRSGGGKNCRG